MNIKLYLLIKYFFSNNKGKFRKSFLFQIIALFIGSFLIALTYGIMDGMEYKISEKIKTFNYKYHVNKRDIVNSFDYLNSGKKSIAEIKFKKESIIVNVLTFNSFNDFCEKIKMHSDIRKLSLYSYIQDCKSAKCDEQNIRIKNIFNQENFIIIGQGLADEYAIEIGDEIKLSDIININTITGSYHQESYLISGIYSFNFINYDYNNVFIVENGRFFTNVNLQYYYDDRYDIVEENSIQNNKDFSTLLSAINLEKYIYVALGGFVLLIASIMIFNNTIIMLLEKRKQYKLLYTQGLSEKFILLTTLLVSILVSFICSTLGYYSSFIVYFLNQKFNLLKYLFMYSPFNEIPIIISFDKYILNLALVLLLTFLATMFAILRVKKEIEEL